MVTARPDLAEPLGAEVVIPMPSGDSRGKGIGPVFSQTCIRYVLNCLYGAVSSFDFEKGEIWRVGVDS